MIPVLSLNCATNRFPARCPKISTCNTTPRHLRKICFLCQFTNNTNPGSINMSEREMI